jgi:GT2 family glycosyltransferase
MRKSMDVEASNRVPGIGKIVNWLAGSGVISWWAPMKTSGKSGQEGFPDAVARPSGGITVLVTNYNGLENLRACLPGILKAAAHENLASEVLVVDDCSTDGSLEFLAGFPQVTVLALKERSSFLGAANAGFKAAQNRYVALLSNDMVPQEDYLATLLPHFADPRLFAVSTVLCDPDGTIEGGRVAGVFVLGNLFALDAAKRYRPFRWLVHEPEGAITPSLYTGGNALFDREKFLELGGFDRLYYPFYWEDTDLCYRAWKQGFRILCDSRAQVTHHQRLGTIRKNFDRTYVRTVRTRNRLLFVWKNIRDPWFLLEHALAVTALLLFGWLGGSLRFYRSFWQALQLWPAVRQRRKEVGVGWRSDRTIMQMVNSTASEAAPTGVPVASPGLEHR